MANYVVLRLHDKEKRTTAFVLLSKSYDEIPESEREKIRGWSGAEQSPFIVAIFPCKTQVDEKEQENRADFLKAVLEKQQARSSAPELLVDMLPKVESELERSVLLGRVSSAL